MNRDQERPSSKAQPRGRRVKVTPTSTGPVLKLTRAHALAFSPDGRWVVAATGGAITELASGRGRATCAFLANTTDVAWSPDGRVITGASTSGKIAVCDARTGARLRVLVREEEGPAPCFLPDGTLCGGDWSGALSRWNVHSGQALAAVSLGEVMVQTVQPLPGGTQLAVLISHRPAPVELVIVGAARLTTERTVRLEAGAEHLAVCDARSAFVASGGWVARLDLKTGSLAERVELDDLFSLEVSADGRWGAITSLEAFKLGPTSALSRWRTLPWKNASRATFSADARRVALASDRRGEVWDLETLLEHGGD